MPRVEAAPAAYQFRLELFHAGRRVHEVRLAQADFSRAAEAAFFDGLRRGLFGEYDFRPEDAVIRPRFFTPDGGSPRLQGFEAAVPTPGGGEHYLAFDRQFFHNLVRRTGAELVLAGKVPQAAVLLYQASAYPEETAGPRSSGMLIELEAEAPVIPIRTGSRKALGPAQAWDSLRPDDFPVLLPRHVIDEAVDEARRAPECEVGGVLLGHLRRDTESGELYLEVTCLVPAEQTQATELSVTFTGETWARVREVIAVRGEEETFIGWMHSHPMRFCAECPLPVRQECIDKVLFFSGDDEFLMELSFARPFMVGLLAAVEPRLEGALGHAPVKLFGWKNGKIEARGFEVIDS
jgi:proteasome lid subunit RPN8/RPN11